MPDHLGDDMRKTKSDDSEKEKEIKCKKNLILNLIILVLHNCTNLFLFIFYILALDEGDIALLKTYVS